MQKIHNEIIDKIQNGAIVYITDNDNEEMMFVCQNTKKNKWTLYSKDYGHYSPVADSLEELILDIQNDWLSGMIIDIEIYDIMEDKQN